MKAASHFINRLFPKRAVVTLHSSAWTIVIIGVIITIFASLAAKKNKETQLQQEFASDCQTIRNSIAERLADHGRILRSGASFFDASTSVSRSEWRIYATRLGLEQQLPGIQGFGFSQFVPREQLSDHIREVRAQGFPDYRVKPDGEREAYSSIIFLEPFSGRNLRAFGFDMFSEPVRRAAMEKARDTDSVVLSGKVVLVQETQSDIQTGVLMYVPVYRHGMPTTSVAQRRAALFGWVYSPYRMNDLMEGTLKNAALHDAAVSFDIFDGEGTSPKDLLYRHSVKNQPLQGVALQFNKQFTIDFNGHLWTLLFSRNNISYFSHYYRGMWVTLALGTVVTLLLFLLVYSLVLRYEIQRKSEFDYHTLADSGQALIWLAGTDKLCFYFNKVWLDFTGRTMEQEYGNGWAEGVHPDDFDRCLEIYVTSFDKRERFSMDYRLRRHDGEYRWIQDDGCPRYDVDGNFIGYIGNCLDITDRKIIETELQAINAELASFTYTVSHDLKSPLITIQGYAGMIRNDMEHGKTTHIAADLARIEEAAAKMTLLLNDLLELSRVGKSMKDPVTLDMNQLAQDVISRLTGIIDANKATVTVQPNLPMVRGDYHRLVEALQNLLENAIKYRSETNAPQIHIGCRKHGNETCFFVQDNGKGIDPLQHEQIFGLFNKLETTTQGSGIGLALVKKIIEKHGGRVWVESEGNDNGSTFCFTIPPQGGVNNER